MLIGSRGARVQPRVLPWGCGSLQTTVGQVDVNSSCPIQDNVLPNRRAAQIDFSLSIS